MAASLRIVGGAGQRRVLKIQATRTGACREDRLPGGKGGVVSDYYLFNSREGVRLADDGGQKWTDVIDDIFNGPSNLFIDETRWTSEIEESLEDAV